VARGPIYNIFIWDYEATVSFAILTYFFVRHGNTTMMTG
jgi:hypothetical protein